MTGEKHKRPVSTVTLGGFEAVDWYHDSQTDSDYALVVLMQPRGK